MGGPCSPVVLGGRGGPGGEDSSVPIPRMTEALVGLSEIGRRHGLGAVHFGHAAEGHIHTGLLVKTDDPAEVVEIEAAMREMHQLALDLDGSVTGEHGIGTARIEFMPQEHGPAYDLMATIKRAIDPDNIMNPGKVFSPEVLLRTES